MMILFLICIATTQAMTFEKWMSKHNKRYNAAELIRRKVIFNTNRKFVAQHNEHHKFKLSIEGPFAAMTNEEYQQLLNHKIDDYKDEEEVQVREQSNRKQLPEYVDWRESNKVTPIRDQGAYGSCFAMGAIASIESRLLILSSSTYTAETLDLSEQQVVDCCTLASGCNGGTLQATYNYIKKNGIMSEKDYPYIEADGECTYDESKIAVTIDGASTTKINDEALMEVVVEAPVGVCIDASQVSFQLYVSGVYDEPNCKKIMNHCVAVIGYGTTEEGEDYYLVKNSWGTSWGEDGYIKMSRGKDNQCSILTDVWYPNNVQQK